MAGRQHLFRLGRGFPGTDRQSLRCGRSGGREKSSGSDLPGGSDRRDLRHTIVCTAVSGMEPVWMQVDPAVRELAGTYFFILCLPMLFRSASTPFGCPPGRGRHQDAHVGGDHCQLHQYRPEFPADL